MTIEAMGEVKTTLPSPGAPGMQGLVHEIVICQNLAATGIVTVRQGTVVIRQFNTPSATGASDPQFRLICTGNALDPTVLNILPDGGGHGAFVTYAIE